MNMQCVPQDPYGFDHAHYGFGATASSSRSSTPPLPSPPYTGVLDQVFRGHNPYTVPFAYDARMQHYVPEAHPSYAHHGDIFSVGPFAPDPGYQCVAPPELHFTHPPSFPPPQARIEYRPSPPECLEDFMLPNPSEIPSSELPKRKGERALARLHRSVSIPSKAPFSSSLYLLVVAPFRRSTQRDIGLVISASKNSRVSPTLHGILSATLDEKTIRAAPHLAHCQLRIDSSIALTLVAVTG